ncbi:4-diphosphocytidyl-2-C-methyl-D-erythritol kinase [Oleiphilus messinensis]|uniref:4-diphosphocytidyl-2-C-methyl-D-erythritol kinase n=1 Tax=Oleiphilus messinensis TaxID=141451 RepID=A0A1Y0I748_9GAMM|nr:4-(cytidine 5'-diphospho)-2-C-methyl-D-erythritol kinase [Oleiphilus messinensis]ARU55264.1 4-diphosphocytidyl-2-C-methyl-D-erythritol kinase [Oleiphilus messinensis]
MTLSSQQSFETIAPAKLNLFLHINGQRDDGYHELQTVFQLLDYGDRMSFTVTDNPKITLTPDLPGVPSEDNLIIKAAKLLQERFSQEKRLPPKGAHITLDKILPMGGGVGGGSSNAATTLLVLNQLWGLHLSTDELRAIGVKLGADVPVFVLGHTAWAEGIGEQLTPIELPEYWFVVLKPQCEINTKKIFSNKVLTRDTQKMRIAPALEGDVAELGNDCEPVVKHLYPEVEQALSWLGQFGRAKLTGTGSCIFAKFSSKEDANTVWSQRPDSLSGFIAKGINKSPTCSSLNIMVT